MSQGRALTHGHVGTPGRDVGQKGQHEPLEHSLGHGGPQLGCQTQGKNMSFATGSVSPRKEPRGRKRRSKLSQVRIFLTLSLDFEMEGGDCEKDCMQVCDFI